MPKYYPINEEAAKRAKDMNSFSDYQPGSATAGYRAMVDEAYAAAERQKARVDPMYHDKIDALVDRYARKLAENLNERNVIDARVPSILISGGGNFPVAKKHKQNAARDRNYGECAEISKLLDKIRSVGMGGISADDDLAVEKLTKKLEGLESQQTTMKEVNAYFRKHKTLDGCPELTPEQAEKLKADMAQSWHLDKSKRTWGKSFIKHYKEIGFLGPWVSFAHAVWLDEEDLQLIAESGAHLITNPSSNLRLRSGIFNMQRANELGIDCGIGLDGCAFDDDQDYLREIRVAWLNNLHNGVDGEVDYKDALKMATSRGAKISACGLSSGILEPGATADFTMISVDSIEKPYADPGIDPLALLVQRGTRQSVIMTCVNGKIAWQQNDESRKKEKDAEIQICTAIKELRAKDDGKRDNSIILQHVHDFYTKRK